MVVRKRGGKRVFTAGQLINSSQTFNVDASGKIDDKATSTVVHASSDTIQARQSAFDQGNVTFTLFIGYLISGATSHDIDYYISDPTAYFCIQVRGWAAVAGAMVIIVTAFVDFYVYDLLSQEVVPDETDMGLTAQEVYDTIDKFLTKIEPIMTLLRYVTYLCLFIFIAGYMLGLYGQYFHDINMAPFLILSAITLLLGGMGAFSIYTSAQQAQAEIDAYSKNNNTTVSRLSHQTGSSFI